ncbi:MAG: 4Fe-4S binding protein [Chloroflexi bacterium]|nr:4Fe-4S binding protein [Chloroflexota bacterium]
MPAKTLQRLRPWVQLAAFLLFVGLLIAAGKTGWLPADLFFRLDPLTGLAQMLATRQITVTLLIGAAIALVAALLLGRAWCGWICPLGTALDWTPARRARPKENDSTAASGGGLSPRWRQVKYFLLALIAVAALLGNLTFLLFDPITIIYRTLTTAVWPALNALFSASEPILYKLPPLRGPIDALESTARGTLLPAQQPLYGLNVLVALLFIGILALNAVRARFWCRYLCPLGGLLGLISKVAWLRRTVGDVCIECQRCARACPTGTIDASRGFASDPAECIMCLDCVPTCSRASQHFAGHLKPAAWRSYDPSRRQFLVSAGAALTAVGLFAAEPAAHRDHARLIRPPGAQEPEFLSRCIRCGICLKVCPTSGLQPSLAEAGWQGLWTPVLMPRLGHCDFACNACGQACPTAAIPPLSLAEKRTAIIGHAYIDRSRCLPWASDRNCIVCEEMCPLPKKAIVLEEAEMLSALGEKVILRRPHVLIDRCIGCGICENRCPLNSESAIRVYAPTDLSAIG